MTPSDSPVTSGLTDQLPSVLDAVVDACALCVPSPTVTLTVEPFSAVPEIGYADELAVFAYAGAVNPAGGFGTAVSFVVESVPGADTLPAASVAVTDAV